MDVTVVVPSKTGNALTAESLPDSVDEVIISTKSGVTRARNDGISQADNDVVILLDDDLRFEAEWFEHLVEQTVDNPNHVFAARGTGLLATVDWPSRFEPGMTRVTAFHRRAWKETGGFKQPNKIPWDTDYGSDTDFLMTAYEQGYNVQALDHKWIHDDEVDEYTVRQNASWLLWLARNHPKLVVPRLPRLVWNGMIE